MQPKRNIASRDFNTLSPHPQMTSRTKLKRKEVDDVLGGDEMWKHADATAGETGTVSFIAHLSTNPPLHSPPSPSFMREM